MTTHPMSLSKLKLTDPFPIDDIEWRVSRAGKNQRGIYCRVLAYITARAIQSRLDGVYGPENWQLKEPRILDVGDKPAFACGISVRSGDEWITKWDVSEPTNIEPAKGGFSGAMKRAGAQWGIGRYLYYLDEAFADVSDSETKGWRYARLSEKHGSDVYYWRPPRLPEWALPKESDVSEEELTALKKAWKKKFMPDVRNQQELREGFTRLVHTVMGEFPVADHACWTKEALVRCSRQIEDTTDPKGPDSDVPFGAGQSES